MTKKLTLNVDALTVSSFPTAAGPAHAAGTVHAHGGDDPRYFDCTCHASCDCPSAYYWCGDGYHTIYSCGYTQNESCVVSKACTA